MRERSGNGKGQKRHWLEGDIWDRAGGPATARQGRARGEAAEPQTGRACNPAPARWGRRGRRASLRKMGKEEEVGEKAQLANGAWERIERPGV